MLGSREYIHFLIGFFMTCANLEKSILVVFQPHLFVCVCLYDMSNDT